METERDAYAECELDGPGRHLWTLRSHGYTTREIAAQIGVSQTTVCERLKIIDRIVEDAMQKDTEGDVRTKIDIERYGSVEAVENTPLKLAIQRIKFRTTKAENKG